MCSALLLIYEKINNCYGAYARKMKHMNQNSTIFLYSLVTAYLSTFKTLADMKENRMQRLKFNILASTFLLKNQHLYYSILIQDSFLPDSKY